MIYLLILNFIAFVVYGWDKRQAKLQNRRISERQLIFLAVLGGTMGAYLAMRIFHHKTKKIKFSIGVPLLLFLQGCLLCIWKLNILD